jgi:hypothetical protein
LLYRVEVGFGFGRWRGALAYKVVPLFVLRATSCSLETKYRQSTDKVQTKYRQSTDKVHDMYLT